MYAIGIDRVSHLDRLARLLARQRHHMVGDVVVASALAITIVFSLLLLIAALSRLPAG